MVILVVDIYSYSSCSLKQYQQKNKYHNKKKLKYLNNDVIEITIRICFYVVMKHLCNIAHHREAPRIKKAPVNIITLTTKKSTKNKSLQMML